MDNPQIKVINYWRGLGLWNFYFLLKFGLLWAGYLNFHPSANLIFLAFLLFPIASKRLHKLRHYIAIPIGLGLFYYDTWLPSLKSIISNKGNVLNFNSDYLVELIHRFINWPLLGMVFAAFVFYLFIAQWIRITTLNVLLLMWLTFQPMVMPRLSTSLNASQPVQAAISNSQQTENSAINGGNQPANNETLNAYLENFYQQEKTRYTQFPQQLSADAVPFDVLIINICSLGISDLQAAGLLEHPLWNNFDISWTQFNSATSYSGPAGIRLLRASCGQTSHTNLYQPTDKQCYLFDNLVNLGFSEQLLMDHSGVFDDYLIHLRDFGGLTVPLSTQAGLASKLISFSGEPIYQDDLLLKSWLDERVKETDQLRTTAFVNLISLHDGNRYIDSKIADYKTRAQALLDTLNAFITQLEQSGRKVLVIVVPEHGAALVGDKMQISGLRDIPSLNITHVPVGLKLIGAKAPHQGSPLKVSEPMSYLALSDLIARLVDGKLFNADTIDWQALTQNLPQTSIVSENENSIVMMYQGKTYVRLNAGDWVSYPQ